MKTFLSASKKIGLPRQEQAVFILRHQLVGRSVHTRTETPISPIGFIWPQEFCGKGPLSQPVNPMRTFYSSH
ncbi:hypothetical protein AGR2A_Cc20104 [Agrobacterium genomosp. 2 str. CFBP 5494]|uniref:Uncharacterized protein n=1 Tax=Agrobacterium genomosp. 2 str. CFBP 5494 TaxID=1183436 RepID=A0A9W5B0Y3_9HYPH|nr:hypothetical protein AGR2A_Cc20104 [Agrobacterium genomosp. 2 str. CFBP 5494]